MVAGAQGSTEATSRLVDTKSLVKLDHYNGEKEKFHVWKSELYVAMRSLDTNMAVMMKHVWKISRLTSTFQL